MQDRGFLLDLQIGIPSQVVAHHMVALLGTTIKIGEAKLVHMVQHKVEAMVSLPLVVLNQEEGLVMPVETLAMGKGVLIRMLGEVGAQTFLVMDVHSPMGKIISMFSWAPCLHCFIQLGSEG